MIEQKPVLHIIIITFFKEKFESNTTIGDGINKNERELTRINFLINDNDMCSKLFELYSLVLFILFCFIFR